MDPSTGRFTTMDSYLGRIQDPTSLHKYLYAHSNPVNYTDPSGYFTLAEQSTASSISGIIAGIYNQASAMALNLFQNLMTTRYSEVVIEVALEMLPLLFYEDVTLQDIAMAFIGGLVGAALNVERSTKRPAQVKVSQISRKEAFRQAKQGAGIPKSSQYKTHKYVYDGTSENRTVYEFVVDGKKKYIIEHVEDKRQRGPHFHGADDVKENPFKKGKYNQYDGHYPEDFNGYKKKKKG